MEDSVHSIAGAVLRALAFDGWTDYMSRSSNQLSLLLWFGDVEQREGRCEPVP